MTTKHPYITWADRKDAVFVTIDVQDAANAEIKITEDTLSFSADAKG